MRRVRCCAVAERQQFFALIIAFWLALGLAAPRPALSQNQTQTLAQAGLPIIPLHHDHIYFTFDINGCEPTQGHYITFQLNAHPTGTACPETLCIASWLRCGTGGVARGRAGVATGTVTTRRLADGWTQYSYVFQVNGAFTQIWDASRKAKVATGSSILSSRVTYERSQPLDPRDRNYSVLGPIAHAADYPGVGVRNFSFSVSAQGSGPSLLIAGRTARWQLSSVFMQNGNFATADFQLTPR
jgi:hypothetical protein